MNTIKCPTCEGDGIQRCDHYNHYYLNRRARGFTEVSCVKCGDDEKNRIKDGDKWAKCTICEGNGIIDENELYPF